MNLDDDFTGKIIAKSYPWKPTVMHICSAQGWQAAVHLGSFFVGGLGDECTA